MDTITPAEQTFVKTIAEITDYTTMLADLDAKRITPRSVVGGGYKNGRLVARAWIINTIRVNVELIRADYPTMEFFNIPTDKEFISAANVVYGAGTVRATEVAARYAK